MSTSLGVLMFHNGDPVTYREAGREAVDLTAIVGFEEASEDNTQQGRKQRLVRDVTICLDPASRYGGVAEPALNAIFDIGTEQYSVESVISKSGSFARLAVKNTKAIERSRQGLRS